METNKPLRNVDLEDLGLIPIYGSESMFQLGSFWLYLDKSKNHIVQLSGCDPYPYQALESHIPMKTLEDVQRRYSSVTGKELFYNPWHPQ